MTIDQFRFAVSILLLLPAVSDLRFS